MANSILFETVDWDFLFLPSKITTKEKNPALTVESGK